MLDIKTKETCRICARELCGNQRRWIFHPASKLNLQVLLSHALGRELTRDGRGEFACSKCAFMLDRMYRFDTVIARVEALSLERLHKLLSEKDRLRQCICGLYRKNNTAESLVPGAGPEAGAGPSEARLEDAPVVDLSALQDVRYNDLIQEDLAYSVYESWADQEDPALEHQTPPPQHHHQCPGSETLPGQRPRRCRGCAALRVPDSDYEAVCKVPRRLGRRSTSCGPSTRYSGSVSGPEEGSEATPVPSVSPPAGPESDRTCSSPTSSAESLDTAVDVCPPFPCPRESSASGLEETLSLVRSWEYKPVKTQQGSRLPVLVKTKLDPGVSLGLALPLRSLFRGAVDCELYPHPGMEAGTPGGQQDLADMEEQWLDDFVQCGPFRFQQRLVEQQQKQLGQYEGAASQCVEELQKAQQQVQQLGQYEGAASQCVEELQKAQQQVQSLQAKIREGDSRNQKLQVRLGEMEGELRSAREQAQKQERQVHNLNDSVNSKETETAELYRVIEEQNNMLCSLKEFANRNKLTQLQVSGAESVRGQGEALELQASLFRAQLDLQASQRAQSQASRKEDDLSRALQRLEHDLQGALEHRENTQRHNQELQMALENVRSELLELREQQGEKEGERLREEEERERTIRELRNSLQTKDQLLQDYSELLEQQQGQKRDSMLSKLRERIKERDRALERAVDEKFRRVEEKEEEVRRLQLLLREKERDLETQRCVLSNNQETITSLEVLLRGKGVELEQVGEAWRGLQRHQQESEERHVHSLRERDALISQLQSTLHSRTQEAEDLTSALLGRVQAGPGEALEGLKARLQLKERLFQELLSDRSLQAREHQAQVQHLLSTIAARDLYIKDSAGRVGEVMSEQTLHIQELRRQLTWASSGRESGAGPGPGAGVELQTLQDELQLGLRREREALEDIHNQAAQLEALSRTVAAKDEIIKDLQLQLVEPSGLPLVERLTQELQVLRQRQAPLPRQTHYGDPSTEGEQEEEDATSEYADSIEEEEELTAQTLANMQIPGRCGGPGKGKMSQDASGEGQGLVEVKQLVEQKRVVERELGELKAQLQKAGFSSLSQMRKAFFSLREENDQLKKQQPIAGRLERDHREEQRLQEEEEEEEEEELDLDLEEEQEVGSLEPWELYEEVCVPRGGCGPLALQRGSQEQRRNATPSLDLGGPLVHSSQEDDLETEMAGSPQQRALESEACVEALRLQQHSRELQERLMVSEATVQAQAEQLKDYRELLTETSVQQDSKQVQVDLQDLGYETCGRSENEAEREDTSSPEFDDLEMCTSLDCGSQWWPAPVHHGKAAGADQDVSSLQRTVEDLRSQLDRSQTAIRELQKRLLSSSASTQAGASTPRRVNWGTQASPSQSGPEEDEGWQSSDGGVGPSPRHPGPGRDLQELETRVGALEDQLRKGNGPSRAPQEAKTGKFDTLIQAQARELSVLRQRVRESLGVCHILSRHLGDTTKAFEELLRANDIDYYMGQSFREQLAQSSALAQRVGTKISGRDHPEMPSDKTSPELIVIRLSEELQQKDKVIESLRTKLQSQPRSDTPCSSHALSETTDQSDRISFVSDEQGSTNEDLELCSEMDAASEYGQEETRSSRASAGYSMPQTKAFRSFPPTPPITQADHPSFLPLSYPPYHPAHLGGPHASLNASPATKPGPSLLESSALWETTYGAMARERVGADLSSGSSGYQSGTSHTGSELMKEHLREIRHLRQRLEDSIQTNERLRQQLEERLASASRETGAPTNIYIQGLDSVSQLSNEIRALKDDNLSLQGQLKQACREGSKEAEHLREAVLMGRARLKEAELEAERWAEQGRRLQSLTQTQSEEIAQLKQERLSNQETINRLQEQVTLLQQQLCEARGHAQSLQHQLDADHRGRGLPRATPPGPPGKTSRSVESATFDPRDLQVQLEQQLAGQGGHARRMLFLETLASPPVRDIGPFTPTSPLSPPLRPEEATDNEAGVSDHAPDGSFSSRSGRHMVGHVDDFSALQQQLLEGCVLIHQLEATLRSSSTSQTLLELSPDKSADLGSLRSVQASTNTLRQILEEASSLLRMFWRAALPSREGAGPSTKKEQALREEISSLRVTVSQHEAALKNAMDRLKTSNNTKDSMEHFIVSQLSRTRDVLKKAKSNLQENELKMASLGLSSSSLPPPSSCSSFSARLGAAENPGPLRERGSPPGWGVLMSLLQAPPPGTFGPLRAAEAHAQRRPLQA